MPRLLKTHRNAWSYMFGLAIIAATAYCSWPLGYILNPSVSARGLASELAAKGQPYNWVFIVGDIFAGVCLAVVAWALWWLVGAAKKRWLRIALITYGLFGILAAIDAALPVNCVPSLKTCPNFTVDHLLLVHGIVSITGASCLGISVIAVWFGKYLQHQYLLMTIALVAWAIFGISSLVLLFSPSRGYLAQHYFITLCSISAILIPFEIWRTRRVSIRLHNAKVL